MLYRVVVDGIDILDYTDPELVLLNPKLELEVNAAGNLEFTLPPYHKYYDLIKILMSTIEVYEDDEMLWFGRPVEQVIDFYKQKRIYCEGPLSFFNDSVQMRMEFDSIQLSNYFRHVVNAHNVAVINKDRSFQVGLITIDDGIVYRKYEYESSYDILKGTCLDTVDGYFFFRRENGINYIDWVKEIPYTSNQSIQFGLNLLDYQSDFDATEFATCVFPLGKDQGNDLGPLTIVDVNGGNYVLESEAVSTYGRIVKFQSWSDIKDPYELLSEGRKFLENTQFNSLTIECNAADLHSFNKEYELFKLGQNVHCVSTPHLIDRDFPISKLSIKLDSAAKEITLGTIKRKTLTRIYKEDTEQSQSQTQDGSDYTPGIITDDDGDPWELVIPTDSGDPVTAVRLPTHITIARNPNKTTYQSGDTLDFTGLLVNIWTKDKNGNDIIWTNPPRYLDGRAPMAELTFSTKKAPNIKNFIVSIVWKYKGKNYYADLPLTVEKGGTIHGGAISTGGWDINNTQAAEVNTLKFSSPGIHYIGCVEPSRKMYVVAIHTAPFSADYRGITNGQQTDSGNYTVTQITYKENIYYIGSHVWHSPRPTPQIPYVSIDEDSSNAAHEAALKAMIG